MHAVGARLQWLAIYQHIIRHLKHGCFIRAGAPDVIIGNDGPARFALVLVVQCGLALMQRFHIRRRIRKNRSLIYRRTAVSNRNIGDADGLHHARLLAGSQWLNSQRRRL